MSDREKKLKVFTKSILKANKNWATNGIDLLEAIHESKSDELARSLNHLPSIAGVKLGTHGVHMLGTLLARRENVSKEERIDLGGCGIGSIGVRDLVQSLEGRNIQVSGVTSKYPRWD